MAETEGPADWGHRKDYAATATQWARDVAAGRIVAGKFVRLAAKRHLKDLTRSKRKAWGYVFDPWRAGDVCDFIEKLPHVQGDWCRCPGKARHEHEARCGLIELEAPQVFILAVVFGWRRRSDGRRRFTDAYVEMARKGAKSTLTAGIALYCLCCEGELGPEVIIGATTGAQALKVFGPAKGMVDKSPDLREAFDLQAWARSITCGASAGFIQTINAKGATQDGWNPHLGILDELHAHLTRALYDVVKSAFGARKNPLFWIITTAGYNTNGVCYEQRTYVAKVLEGVLAAEHYFGIIFTIDDGDDPFDPKVWVKANPMLGVTPTLESMQRYAADAKASPASEGEFKTKRLNVWLNSHSAWLNMARWKACADPKLDWSDFEGLDCFIGGDLADKDDITALVLAAFRPSPTLEGETQLIIKPVFWLPEAVLEDPKHAEGRGPAPYRTWRQQGFLQLTPGDWVDHNAVEAVAEGWIERFRVIKATFDQFAAAQAMASRLNDKHATPDDPVAQILHKKASAVTDPARELERRVKGGRGRFCHDDNPVMNWMASNVVVVQRRDETILPIKESQSSPNKIDGIDAAVNAIEPACRSGAAPSRSYLEEDELMIL